MTKIFFKKDDGLQILSQFQSDSWTHLENPSHHEIEEISQILNLDEGLLFDSLDPFEVPRIENEDDITYIFTRFCQSENGVITTTPILIVLGEDFIITISMKHFELAEKVENNKFNLYTTERTKLFLQLFSQITGTYNQYLTNISRQIKSISVQLERIENKHIIKFVNFETILNDFLFALVPTNEMLKRLLNGRFLLLYENERDSVEDLFLYTGQIIEICKANLKSIVNIREAYSTIMTNNLNRVIKVLTSLTIILTIPTIIGSLYGMNVKLPFEDSPYAFWGVLASIIFITVLLVVVFIKKRWM